MTKYVIIILALYGAGYYVRSHYSFSDLAAYAQNHPKESWAPAVEYYSGVAYYFRSNCPKAEEIFSQMLATYSDSKYEDQALLYIDDCAESAHDWPTAKTVLQQYVDHFPSGKGIETAKKRLEMINYSHP